MERESGRSSRQRRAVFGTTAFLMCLQSMYYVIYRDVGRRFSISTPCLLAVARDRGSVTAILEVPREEHIIFVNMTVLARKMLISWMVRTNRAWNDCNGIVWARQTLGPYLIAP